MYKYHSSDHFILKPEIIQKLGININGSTVEVYTLAKPQEIRSFIRCVLRQEAKIIKI